MEEADRHRKRAWKDEQRSLARGAFPLASEVLGELFAAVDEGLAQDGCDHTLRATMRWLNANNIAPQPTLAWLEQHGGFCDCEVIANACDHWEQNR